MKDKKCNNVYCDNMINMGMRSNNRKRYCKSCAAVYWKGYHKGYRKK